MLLTEVENSIKCNNIYNLVKEKIHIKCIYTNSQHVKKNSLFVIENKINDKKKYIKQAIEKGAKGILTDKYISGINLSQFVVSNINNSVKKLLFKLKPNKPLNTISVTGTNGKTSVVWYISQFCINNNINVKFYGTLGYFINSKKINDSLLTTPAYDVLHQTAFLKKKNTYNYLFEASSHAIQQNRLKDFEINIAAITNITHDHIDYHKNFDNYKNVKFRLFTKHLRSNGFAILNDKIEGIYNLKKSIKKDISIITYGKSKSNIYIKNNKKNVEIKFFNKKYTIKSIIYSNIKLENISCAIACAHCLGISFKKILKNLLKIKDPIGRLQKVHNKKNYNVFIDYAHTPDALKKVLIDKTIDKKPNILFGCGGNRDKDKREKMGEIANKFASKIYITDDNPRNEDPSKIRKSIMHKCKKAKEIPDRKIAIFSAIKDLKKNETLIIAGKGHENFQINKNSTKCFDDLKIAKKALNNKENEK